MKKYQLFLVPLLTVLALLLAACQPAVTPEPVAAEKTKVAILLPGLVTDQSWNQAGYEGLVQAKKECGIDFAYSEEISQDEQRAWTGNMLVRDTT